MVGFRSMNSVDGVVVRHCSGAYVDSGFAESESLELDLAKTSMAVGLP